MQMTWELSGERNETLFSEILALFAAAYMVFQVFSFLKLDLRYFVIVVML